VSRQPPPGQVLAAFGVAGLPLRPLGGGQGTSWRAGPAVLKPADQSLPELEWLADVYSKIGSADYRIARQRRSITGAVRVDGWSATDYLAGEHASRRWPDAIAAGEVFHSALAGVARPAFLDHRVTPWVTGDLVAWGELPSAEFAGIKHLPRLEAAVRPVAAPSQLIHGDLGGNVLFDDVLPPAIIDFSPYWRPVPFASAIVIADALVWEDADMGILTAVRQVDDFGQYLVRALIYRAVTEWILSDDDPRYRRVHEQRYAPVVDLACRLADSES
jgi:uncharacterized protein (TIGR02569 family)